MTLPDAAADRPADRFTGAPDAPDTTDGAGGAIDGAASDATSGNPAFSWAIRAPLPIPRTDYGVAVVAGKIYVLGGFSGSVLARVDEYDPNANAWTAKADLPRARRGLAVGVANGKIYATAGTSWTDPNAVTYINDTVEYDPASDRWTARAPFPMAPPFNQVLGNDAQGGAAVNDRLYVVEFNSNTPSFTSTREYDPGTDSWTNKSPIPFDWPGFAATALNGRLYVFASYLELMGGRLAYYSPADDLWIIRSSMPQVGNPGFVAANGKLYTLGGRSGPASGLGVTDAIYEYDPVTDAWSPRGQLSRPRQSPGAAEVGGHVFVMGGSAPDGTPLELVEEGIPR
ncbi:MAG TPA: hypothetical protein VKN99_26915 [Polyangia bacterium]|nr:hypothetical protein [Polyangia bacterium]